MLSRRGLHAVASDVQPSSSIYKYVIIMVSIAERLPVSVKKTMAMLLYGRKMRVDLGATYLGAGVLQRFCDF